MTSGTVASALHYLNIAQVSLLYSRGLRGSFDSSRSHEGAAGMSTARIVAVQGASGIANAEPVLQLPEGAGVPLAT